MLQRNVRWFEEGIPETVFKNAYSITRPTAPVLLLYYDIGVSYLMTSGEEQLYPGNNNGSRDDTNKEIGGSA